MKRLRAAAFALFLAAGLPFAADAQTPFSGTPIAVPGSFQAEDFDRGGEGVAYHDNVPGNAGGQYRTSEDVDIIVSSDPEGGGFVVNSFETGEWMAYTINVSTGGNYDIELRVATSPDFPDSAYHAEIDGVNVTGTVALPVSGSWETFQWLGKRTVTLAAGQHVLKIVADQQYFNLNSVRVLPTTTSRSEESAAAYTGSWVPRGSETASFSDGTALSSDVASSTATFTFTGTAVSWIGLKCNVCGIATVSIDGGAADTVNTAGPGAIGPASGLSSEVVFSRAGLATGVSHTMVITVTGTTTSGGAHIVVDAFDVTATRIRIEDTAPAVSYTGTWVHLDDSRASGGTFAESRETGAKVTLSFTGTGVRWLSARNNNNGIARVSVDGVDVGDVDTYGPTLEVAEFDGVAGLTRAAHTLTIAVTGNRNPDSSDTWVIIDAFDVTP